MANTRKKQDEQVEEQMQMQMAPWEDDPAEGNLPAVPEDEPEEAVAVGTRQYYENPELDPDDVFMPRLRLAQGLTEEVQDGVAKPGQWLLSGHEPVDSVDLVPIMMGKGRELRDEDTRDILCASRDGKTGVGEPGGACSTCPMARWSDSRDGKRVPPPCIDFYSYLAYSITHDTPVVVEFRRTAKNAGKQINSIIQARGLGNFGITLKQNSSRGPKGTYYVPAVSLLKLEPDIIAQYRERVLG